MRWTRCVRVSLQISKTLLELEANEQIWHLIISMVIEHMMNRVIMI